MPRNGVPLDFQVDSPEILMCGIVASFGLLWEFFSFTQAIDQTFVIQLIIARTLVVDRGVSRLRRRYSARPEVSGDFALTRSLHGNVCMFGWMSICNIALIYIWCVPFSLGVYIFRILLQIYLRHVLFCVFRLICFAVSFALTCVRAVSYTHLTLPTIYSV